MGMALCARYPCSPKLEDADNVAPMGGISAPNQLSQI